MRTILVAVSLLGLACHREALNRAVSEAERDASCQRCLAQGRTWQGVREGECTIDCDIQDTFCYRDACPRACSGASCSSCLGGAECKAASCEWHQANEAMWCASKADTRSEPTKCHESRSARVQREGTSLAATMTIVRTCEGKATNEVVELARAELEQSASCPVGEVFAEDGRAEVPDFVLAEFGEQLERVAPRALGAVEGALSVLSESRGASLARAFVVKCSEPTFLLVAEGAEPRAQILRAPRSAARSADCSESTELGEETWFGRELATNLSSEPSSLTTSRVIRTGTSAKLIVHELIAPKVLGPVPDAQPEGTWSCRRSMTYEGLSDQPGVFDFPDLDCHCATRMIPVAPETARRVRTQARLGCNRSRWNTAARRLTKVLVCDFGGVPAFLAQPGVEQVSYDEECVEPIDTLRAIPRDGGVAPAVKLSEQPRDSSMPQN